MWWKLLLLTLYLGVLFLLSRLLEAVAWYEGGYIASRLLDPVSLSVKKLKMLLDQRGVSYAGLVEKQELTDLMDASGDVKEGELEMATLADGDSTASTNFTCGSHFYEEVEDTKDSVWVVQVIRQPKDTFMRQEDWQDFVKRVTRFGVRTGIFDCTLDWRLCDRKHWYSSRLVLALPQGYRPKDTVVLRDYMSVPKTRQVLDWVNANLASRITQIASDKELQNDWQNFNTSTAKCKVRVVLFSSLSQPPMFLSVLSVKFTGRVQFGMVNSHHKQFAQSRSSWSKLPAYVILTPEKSYRFGDGAGEYLNFNSMALFLRTLHPEVNDIFLLSLVLVNVSCWLEICIIHGVVLKRVGHLLWHVGKWNFLLILLWLPCLALFQLPYMDQALNHVLTGLRMLGTVLPMAWLRSDWLWYADNLPLVFAVFVIYAVVVALFHYKYQDPNAAATEVLTSDFFSIPWDDYTNYLFRPMSTLTQPMPQHQDYDLEVGMEMLIARLAVPNFWLKPVISSDYINELPVWKYLGPNIDSDFGSDTDAMSLQSEGEDCGSGSESVCSMSSNPEKRPFMFICEKCRALQASKENEGKTLQQLEQERLESESACAKFLMDGDYKCSCQLDHRAVNKKSPKKERLKKKKEAEITTTTTTDGYSEMPAGMLTVSECAICLESLRYGAFLCGLPCGHSFHQGCIMGWLSRDNHCCPVCRWPAYKAKPCSLHLHAE